MNVNINSTAGAQNVIGYTACTDSSYAKQKQAAANAQVFGLLVVAVTVQLTSLLTAAASQRRVSFRAVPLDVAM